MATATRSTARKPTYGELIDLFEEAEQECPNNEELLCAKFKTLYPKISIGRPRRFYETVSRIVAPTKPSLRGECKLYGSPMTSYRKRVWQPRVRNPATAGSIVKFPPALREYGLSEEKLKSTFLRVQSGKQPLQWSLKGVPEVGFYQELHPFLKKWPITCGKTKQAIGSFYIAIDHNLKEKGSRADNVYRFIEGIYRSGQPSKTLMQYGFDQAAMEKREVKSMQLEVKECREQVQSIATEYCELKRKFEDSRRQLHDARQALHDITNEKVVLQKQRDVAEKKARLLHKLKSEYASLEEDFIQLQEDNADFSSAVAALESELASVSDCTTSTSNDMDFTFQTKSGRRYSPAIRKLYYSLLCDQVPSSKIADIVRMVVKCFNPSIDVEQLKLPQRACADYMRREELRTVSNAHKATILCEHAAAKKGFLINTDGTTKAQRKLGGVAINDMVISVNELPDGTAESAISDISRELEKLRHTAHALGMPNPDSINWTLLVASTSDSAATQKRMNKLIEQCRDEDEIKYGSATIETVDLIETFCSMHLGVNLRKAFLSGIVGESDDQSSRKYNPVDTLVHEFCKVFGKHGTPEYGCGVLGFPDFLELMTSDSTLSEEARTYYKSCCDVKLERQVGSRYFVSAANAAKIVFLAKAAVDFLKFTGKDAGNKLERDLLAKLQDPHEITRLRADGLMYFHVYADLVMLSKSNIIGKSVMDMSKHYLELQLYLQELERHPEVLDKDYHVFVSEETLYGTDKNVNHRCHHSSKAVYRELFDSRDSDPTTLHRLVVTGATKMRDKLCAYAKDQLPGGKYWDPEPSVKKVLAELKPSNDLCESILGLNDFLTTAIPNLHQMARSNLVQVKKNHTMKWLHDLPSERQLQILDLAVKERRNVAKECKHEDEQRNERRRQNMLQANVRREAIKQKARQERDQLSQEHLITSSQELRQAMIDIDTKQCSAAKKRDEKLSLLKKQVKVRKKVLGQNVHIVFTRSRKQRPMNDLVKELSTFIDQSSSECSSYIEDPISMVGKHIQHRFEIDNTSEVQWYHGTVIDYNDATKLHEIEYEGEEEHCSFNLRIDLLNGDIRVLES